MEIAQNNAEELVTQLQHAHRLSVAFYRRLLPTLDTIAVQLGCEFWYWEPLETNMPGRSSTRPSSKWAWDFVPLYAANYVYWRTNGLGADPHDVAIALCVYIDDSFASTSRSENGIKGQPDAVTLPIGKALLQAYIFRPIAKSQHAFNDLWREVNDPEIGTGSMKPVSKEMEAIAFEWPLSKLLCNYQAIVDTLKPFANRD